MSLRCSTRTRLRSLTNPGILRGFSSSSSTNAAEPLSSGATTLFSTICLGSQAALPDSLSSLPSRKKISFAGLGLVPSLASSPTSSIDTALQIGGAGKSTRATSLCATMLSPIRVRAPSLRLISGTIDTVAYGSPQHSRISSWSSFHSHSQLSAVASPCGVQRMPSESTGSLVPSASYRSIVSALLEPLSEAPLLPSASDFSLAPPAASLRASPLIAPPISTSRNTAPPPESPLAHMRRGGIKACMHLQSTASQHMFSAQLKEGLATEMVTVYVKRGCRLAITVDAWHLEEDSHYEWEIAFTPQDVDMSSIRASLEPDAHLVITIQRRQYHLGYVSPPVVL